MFARTCAMHRPRKLTWTRQLIDNSQASKPTWPRIFSGRFPYLPIIPGLGSPRSCPRTSPGWLSCLPSTRYLSHWTQMAQWETWCVTKTILHWVYVCKITRFYQVFDSVWCLVWPAAGVCVTLDICHVYTDTGRSRSRRPVTPEPEL